MIFCILRLPVITLLLQRGAFDAATTRGVAGTLPWMLVGSVAMFGTQVAYRILYGQNMHAFPAVVGLIVPGLYLSVALLLGKSLGFQGICIAYAVSWWLAFLVLLLKVFAVDRGPIWELTGTPVWGTVMALMVTAATVLWGQKLLLTPPAAGGKLGIGLRCITVAGAGIASFALTGALIWPRSDVRQILLSRRAPARRK
jgi:putative peptidoglycan lipid II flippase